MRSPLTVFLCVPHCSWENIASQPQSRPYHPRTGFGKVPFVHRILLRPLPVQEKVKYPPLTAKEKVPILSGQRKRERPFFQFGRNIIEYMI